MTDCAIAVSESRKILVHPPRLHPRQANDRQFCK
ncbi:hypothetical protein SMICM304S_06951 [Streptomyces microflavus]